MGWPTPAGQPVTLVASGISSLLVLSDAIFLPTMSDTWMFFYYMFEKVFEKSDGLTSDGLYTTLV